MIVIDFLQVGVEGLYFFVGQKIARHNPGSLADTLANLLQCGVANVWPADGPDLPLPIGVCGNDFSGTSVTMTCCAAGAVRVAVEHLPVLKIRNEVFAHSGNGNKQKKKKPRMQWKHPTKEFSI